MQKRMATLLILWSLNFTGTVHAAENSIDLNIQTSDDLAFEEIIRGLHQELNDFSYRHGIYLDSRKQTFLLMAWFASYSAITRTLSRQTSYGIFPHATWHSVWGPIYASLLALIGTHYSPHAPENKICRHIISEATHECAHFREVYNSFRSQAIEVMRNAANNAFSREYSKEQGEREAKLAVFKFFLKNFQTIIGPIYTAIEQSDLPRIFLYREPCFSNAALQQFYEEFFTQEQRRSNLGLHVIASQFTFPQEATNLILNYRYGRDRVISTLPIEIIFIILRFMHNLDILPPPKHLGDCG